MSLRDKACYTLTLDPSPLQPGIIELNEFLVDGSKAHQAQYIRAREEKEGEAYSASVYDAFTGAKLASCGYDKEKNKRRRLELHGPDERIDFEFTGKLGFEWTFTFEENKYRWTREVYGKDYICSLDRKPDPKVEVCLARESEKGNPGRIQFLHYNIDRFPDEIRDLRGLETLLVTTPPRRGSNSTSGVRPVLERGVSSSSTVDRPSVVPEKVISEDDYEPENPNEILVSMTSSVDDHIARAVGLLLDPAVLFVVIRTRTASATQRALEVSLGVTRFRHREGLGDLHQYVVEQEDEPPLSVPKAFTNGTGNGSGRLGPKVIKLDDEPIPIQQILPRRSSTSLKKKEWTAPKGIAIYLSTIELPDLKPKIKDRTKSFNGSAPSSTPAPLPPLPVKSGSGGEKMDTGFKSGSGSSIGKLFRHKT